MPRRRLTFALLIGAVTSSVGSTAAADDGAGSTKPTASSTCDTASCQLLVRVPGQAEGSSDRHHGPQYAETPVCFVVPDAVPAAGTAVGDSSRPAVYQARRECFVQGRLVSSEPVVFTVEPDSSSAARLAKQAYGTLLPPKPAVEMSPSPGIPQLTGLPTWLFLKPGSWASTTASASASGTTVTATARPQSVSWAIGDGGTVTCQGPGTPYPARSGPADTGPSPDCGYTYRRTSAGMADGVFDVTVTISWTVDWSGGGKAGSFPGLRSTVHVPVRVVEASALVTSRPS